MKLSVIICCYNERKTIADIVERTRQVDLGEEWEREIIIVDNASTDGTQEILRALDDPEISVIFHERNLGKGMSIRTGIGHMSGDYFFIQDADAEYDPAEQARFTAAAARTGAAAIFGSRVLGGEIKSKYLRTLLGNRFLTWLTNFLFGGNLTDVATASKMVRGDLAKTLNLTCTGFDLDFELPNKILLAGHDIHEIPISYDPRTYAEGKKIKGSDAVRAVSVMVRDRLGLSPVFKPAESNATKKVQSS
jgi:glycosyltransferase involved in cell wall biosynthesis